MNAIEIRGLCKSFGEKAAVNGLDMTVPMGAIYGFIGENGSGKSTTEKMITGLIPKGSGSIRLYGREYTDPDIRARMGVLIEAPGCFGNLTVWDNMMLEAHNLSLVQPEAAVARMLRMVRMEGAAGNKYQNCSLGMKQRVGIAMALLGDPALLVLDEPLNGLDADGMRIMREVLTEIVADGKRTILVSSHLLGELEKIATHYGIIRHGRMLCEMTKAEMDADCRTFVALRAENMPKAHALLSDAYARVETDESGCLRVYDSVTSADVAARLYASGVTVTELWTDKIGLEEYYTDLMKGGKGK